MAERDLYIDRLRTITTAQVVVFHAAITYGSADRVVARLAHRNSCYRRSVWSAKSSFGGGLSWPSILYALWEPFVAWGLIAAWLLVFRSHMNQPSALWSWLNRRAYAVYIIHPPILVGVTLLHHSFVAPALVKFCLTGALACGACWLIADPLVRIPGLRRIV